MVDALDGDHWDLGSIPRSPKIIVSYFSSCNYIQVSKSVPPYASHLSMPCGHKLGSKGQDWMIMVLPGQSKRGWSPKVKKAWVLMGLEFTNKPPLWANTPLVYSFFVLSFLLFLLIIIIYLINIINIFHNKFRQLKNVNIFINIIVY